MPTFEFKNVIFNYLSHLGEEMVYYPRKLWTSKQCDMYFCYSHADSTRLWPGQWKCICSCTHSSHSCEGTKKITEVVPVYCGSVLLLIAIGAVHKVRHALRGEGGLPKRDISL